MEPRVQQLVVPAEFLLESNKALINLVERIRAAAADARAPHPPAGPETAAAAQELFISRFIVPLLDELVSK